MKAHMLRDVLHASPGEQVVKASQTLLECIKEDPKTCAEDKDAYWEGLVVRLLQSGQGVVRQCGLEMACLLLSHHPPLGRKWRQSGILPLLPCMNEDTRYAMATLLCMADPSSSDAMLNLNMLSLAGRELTMHTSPKEVLGYARDMLECVLHLHPEWICKVHPDVLRVYLSFRLGT
jgi:hypothetical protein